MNRHPVLRRTPVYPLLRQLRLRRQLRPVVVTVDGFKLSIPRRDTDRYAAGFEPLTMRWLREVARPGMTAVDVGAALGVFSLYLSRMVGPGGRVIAIEPTPKSVKLLRRNATRNGAAIEIIQAAAADSPGVREFYLTRSSDSNAFFRHPLIAPSGRMQVDTITLDQTVAKADLVKIDVEGAELDVLRGAARLLDERPVLVVEWVPACQVAAGHDPGELPQWLERAGYRCELFDEQGHVSATVDDTLHAYASGSLPVDWYSNLCCLPSR